MFMPHWRTTEVTQARRHIRQAECGYVLRAWVVDPHDWSGKWEWEIRLSAEWRTVVASGVAVGMDEAEEAAVAKMMRLMEAAP